MKKIITIFLTCLLFINLTACSSENEEKSGNSNEDSKIVTLTTKNIFDYLSFDGKYENYDNSQGYLDYYYGYADLDFSIFPIESGSFKNVQIKMRINISSPGVEKWRLDHDDPAYDENYKNSITATFKLPVDGKVDELYELSCFSATSSSCIERPEFSINDIQIISVTGEFEYDN